MGNKSIPKDVSEDILNISNNEKKIIDCILKLVS